MKYEQQIMPAEKQEIMTTTFRGYNHNEVIADGEMYDTTNLSADQYPTVSLRNRRGITSYDEQGQASVPLLGVHGREKLTLIRGTEVRYNNAEVSGITVSTAVDMLPKKIVGFGAYVCIWPDKVFFNTTDLKDCGSMERLWCAEDHVADADPERTPFDVPRAQICRLDGTDYDMTTVTVSATEPTDPDDGDFWIDQSGETDVLRQWNDAMGEWVEVPSVYVKIRANGIGKGLNMYDTINIQGLTAVRSSSPPDARVTEQLAALNGAHIVYGAGNNYVIIAGILSSTQVLETSLRADREIPDFDYIVESNNRLWGCRYGRTPYRRVWAGFGWDTQLKLCKQDGTEYDFTSITTGATEPDSPAADDLWMRKRDVADYVLMKCTSANPVEWEIETTYVKICGTGIGKSITKGMEIHINGLQLPTGGTLNPELQVQVGMLNGVHPVTGAEKDYIIIEGVISENVPHTGNQGATAENVFVSMYNKENADAFLNEIHASKLGDFRNWDSYMGLSTDSYTASVGTDGPFTGAVTQLGYPIFFKENAIHRVYGQTPDSFQIQTTMCRGIQEGSWRSAVVVNEAIYYKSRTDVMLYDGNMPVSISEQLGKKSYSDARAGAVDGKLYISMKDGDDNKWYQFSFDTKLGVWYREDRLKAMMYATVRDELFLIDEEHNTLVTVNGTSGTAETGVPWQAVFGISGIEYSAGGARMETRGYRYLSRFDIRMYLAEGSDADLWIEYNSDGTWRHQGKIRGRNIRSFLLPVIPYRCDHLRVKMTGTGDFRIFSISRILEVGGDG